MKVKKRCMKVKKNSADVKIYYVPHIEKDYPYFIVHKEKVIDFYKSRCLIRDLISMIPTNPYVVNSKSDFQKVREEISSGTITPLTKTQLAVHEALVRIYLQ